MGNMTKDELYTAIRRVIEQSPMGPDIAKGLTLDQCKNFSGRLYHEFQRPENRIEGLSLAVVTAVVSLRDHAWLVAHHPSTGYFMIDPTISQFVKHADGRPLTDAFIGTYEQLEKMLSSDKYVVNDHIYAIWPPMLQFEGQNDPKSLWQRYEFPIGPRKNSLILRAADPQTLGYWAAHMEGEGIDWIAVLRRHWNKDNWPDAKNEEEMNYYRAILAERDKYDNLGSDRKGRSYRQILAGQPRDPTASKGK